MLWCCTYIRAEVKSTDMTVRGDSYFVIFLCKCGYGRSKVIRDDPSVAHELSEQTLSYWKAMHSLGCNKKPFTAHITEQ